MTGAMMSLRKKSMAFAGDTLRAEGQVASMENNVVTIRQRLMTQDRVAAEATTEIRLPA